MKLNIGSGRLKKDGYINIDIVQIYDGNDNKTVDLVLDIEKDSLPYEDNSVDEILADNVLEHIDNLRFVLNQCNRVLKEGCSLRGCVPVAGSVKDYMDITHKRHFIKESFGYLTGQAEWTRERKPKKPRYADYGFIAWEKCELEEKDDMIYFNLIK